MSDAITLRLSIAQALTQGMATPDERELLRADLQRPGVRAVADLSPDAQRVLTNLQDRSTA